MTDQQQHTSSTDLNQIAQQAYVFLFPLALMDVTRRVSVSVPPGTKPGFGPMNQFSHMRAFPPGNFKEVVRPNYDTLYSTLWFDVGDEPLVLSAPDTHGRYYMLPMLDMWSDVFAVVGSRTTGTGAGHYALVGPGWSGQLPDGMQRIDAPTPFGWVIGRTQTNGVADYENVHAIQDGFVATPLSRWPNPPGEVAFTPDGSIDLHVGPMEQVLAMAGAEFFGYGAELMKLHRPHLVDQPMVARMARLGLVPGEQFGLDGNPEVAAAVAQAPVAAQAWMIQAQPTMAPIVNGWVMLRSGMGVYGTDYLRRAIVAKIGLGANLVEDAIYPILAAAADGQPADGSHAYVLHFESGQLPPAGAFWSVTMYDGDGFPVPNEIERYAIGDRDQLNFNADGSLDLFIQHDDPGDDRRSNWLPAPNGPLGVTMRIYDPAPEVADGRWSPPPLQRAD